LLISFPGENAYKLFWLQPETGKRDCRPGGLFFFSAFFFFLFFLTFFPPSPAEAAGAPHDTFCTCTAEVQPPLGLRDYFLLFPFFWYSIRPEGQVSKDLGLCPDRAPEPSYCNAPIPTCHFGLSGREKSLIPLGRPLQWYSAWCHVIVESNLYKTALVNVTHCLRPEALFNSLLTPRIDRGERRTSLGTDLGIRTRRATKSKLKCEDY
jgi:hypothetical protein